MSKIWTNWDTITWLSRKHCGKRRNCLYEHFLLFPQCFYKLSSVDASKCVSIEKRGRRSAIYTTVCNFLSNEVMRKHITPYQGTI